MLRFGIIGCGWAGQRHATAVRELSESIRLVAVCDEVPEKAAALARAHGVATHGKDLSRILDGGTVDAVSLCLPHHLHAEVACRAAGAGLHVLVEKPLSATLEEADRMIDAARTHAVVLMVAEPVRYRRLFRRVAEVLEEGAIGQPFLFRIAREHQMHRYLEDRPWFLEDPAGGIMYSGGIHDFDMLRLLAGEVEHVYALQSPKALSTMRADDTSTALIGLVSGAVAVIVESFSIRTQSPGVSGVIHGTAGTLHFDADGIALYTDEEDGHPERSRRLQDDDDDPFVSELQDFADSIREGRQPVSTAEEGRSSLACVVAAYQSIRTGQRVCLQTPG